MRITALWSLSTANWNFPHFSPCEKGGRKVREILIYRRNCSQGSCPHFFPLVLENMKAWSHFTTKNSEIIFVVVSQSCQWSSVLVKDRKKGADFLSRFFYLLWRHSCPQMKAGLVMSAEAVSILASRPVTWLGSRLCNIAIAWMNARLAEIPDERTQYFLQTYANKLQICVWWVGASDMNKVNLQSIALLIGTSN